MPTNVGGLFISGEVITQAAAEAVVPGSPLVRPAFGGTEGCASVNGSCTSVERRRPGPVAVAAVAAAALPRGTVRITGSDVTPQRSGTVGAEARPPGRDGGGLRGVVVPGVAVLPMRGLRPVPRGVTALRSPAPSALVGIAAATATAVERAPSDLDLLRSTWIGFAGGEAVSRGGIRFVSRFVKQAMAAGTCPPSPVLSGDRPADGEGELRGETEDTGTLPAPVLYVV